MTAKNICILFAAVDQKSETVATMRDFVFRICTIIYSRDGYGDVVSSGEKIVATQHGGETHQIECRSRDRDRCRYTAHLRKYNDHEPIATANFDFIVLFVSADWLFKRPENESWTAYFQSCFARLAPVPASDSCMRKLSLLFEELRQSGGNYRLQNNVWVVVTDDNDCVRKSEWANIGHATNSSRTLFLRAADASSTARYLWNYIAQ